MRFIRSAPSTHARSVRPDAGVLKRSPAGEVFRRNGWSYAQTNASDLALSEAMNAAWGQFAAAGDPNGAGVPAWPRYDAARDSTLFWDIPSAARDGIRTAACDFWDALTPAP